MLTFPTQRSYRAAVKLNPSLEATPFKLACSLLWCSGPALHLRFRNDTIEKVVIDGEVHARLRDIDRIRLARAVRAAALKKTLEAAGRKGQRIEFKEGMQSIALDPKNETDVSEMDAILCHVCEAGLAEGGLLLSLICQRRVGRGWVPTTAHLRVADAYAIDVDHLRRTPQHAQDEFEGICMNLRRREPRPKLHGGAAKRVAARRAP